MNERIRELVNRCGGWWYHGDHNMPASIEFSESEVEELVATVVQECMAIADKTQLVDRQLAVSFALKEHFGVE